MTPRNPGLIIFSLLCGIAVAVLFLGVSGVLPGSRNGTEPFLTRGGEWAILSFDGGEDDREITRALKAGGFDVFFSESNQTVYVNDFGGLKAVALDNYNETLETFDPRNDGYAEKLKSLFVRDGRRYVFVSLEGKNGSVRPETVLRRALADFSFNLEIPGSKNFPLNLFDLFNILTILAGIAAVLFAFLLCREKRLCAPFIPLLLAFSCTGPLGLVLAALLMGLRGLAGGFFGELFPRRYYGTFVKRLRPYRLHIFLYAVFIFLFFLICGAGNVPMLPSAAGFVLFILLEFYSFKVERRAGAVRFEPVWMLPGRAKISGFRLPLVPFAAAALALLLQSVLYPSLSSSSYSGRKPSFVIEDFVSPVDYDNHLAFQLSFSQKPLFPRDGEYLRYYLGEDGLIEGGIPEAPEPFDGAAGFEEAPPFPLENLRAYLIQCNEEKGGPAFDPVEWISAVLLLIICVPGRHPGRNSYGIRKKTALFRDRRIAA